MICHLFSPWYARIILALSISAFSQLLVKVVTVYILFQLWVGPGSKAAEEKSFFDSHLAPFYRIEQVLHIRIFSLVDFFVHPTAL